MFIIYTNIAQSDDNIVPYSVHTQIHTHTYTNTVFINIKAELIYKQGIKYTLSITVE